MVLTRQAVLRIAKDVKYIINNPIQNIFYKHDNDNLTIGYALIIGNLNTPYSLGNYLFQFTFPDNYPYEPPKLKFLTNDGSMRFHPNLYINGKVCLSIINTWNGEGWTSCNNINSILLILSSILDNNSLTYEPGIDIQNINVKKYNFLVSYKNIEYTIIKIIKFIYTLDENYNYSNINDKIIILFKNEILQNFFNNYKTIYNNLENLKNNSHHYLVNNNNNNTLYISTYSLNFLIDFQKIKNEIDFIINKYNLL
tara:strand:+ start:1204 stop:1965 length:762 start_codon:yes stop_codon:yes gene_type:complete